MDKGITSSNKDKSIKGTIIPANLRMVAESELIKDRRNSLINYGFVNYDQGEQIALDCEELSRYSDRNRLFEAFKSTNGNINFNSRSKLKFLIEESQFNKFELQSKGYIEQAIILGKFSELCNDKFLLLNDVPEEFYEKLHNDSDIQVMVKKQMDVYKENQISIAQSL